MKTVLLQYELYRPGYTTATQIAHIINVSQVLHAHLDGVKLMVTFQNGHALNINFPAGSDEKVAQMVSQIYQAMMES